MINDPTAELTKDLNSNYKANNLASGRAAPVVNDKEIYFNAHIKMSMLVRVTLMIPSALHV